MPRGRDEAGNIWELDANGKPVRRIQPASPSFAGSIPGVMGVVPPNPAMVAKDARDQSRQDAADQRAADAARRAQAEWNASHNPDGSPKVQAPSLLGDPTKTGPEYLASLPQNIRARVQQLLEGRSILTAREKGQPLGQQLMDAANQADPTFDENVSHARYVERTQYTGQGKGSLVVQAADRLAQHAHDLYEASRALGGPDLGWAPLSNAATATTNSFRQQKVAAYNNILPIIQGEIQKLTKNGTATEGEAKEIEAGLSVNQPQDVRDQALKTLIHLSQAQMEPLRRSWGSAWAGTTAPPMPMDFHPQTQAIFDTIEQGKAPLQHNNKGGLVVPPEYGGGGSTGTGGDAPPPLGPSGSSGPMPGGIPKADFSSMVGGPDQTLAVTDPNSKLGAFKQTYRQAYDPVGAAALSAFIRKGAPYETAAAYAQSHGFNPPPQADYQRAVAFQKANPNATPNVEADKNIPTTLGERLASSPLSAALAGGAAGATAGISDAVGRTLAGPGWDANRAALSAAQPGADVFGNVVGGGAGMLGGEALLGKIAPGALALAGKASPVVSDLAYGGLYGANENPADPLMGAVKGALVSAGGGMAGRAATRGLAGVIAPSAGPFAPLYEQGGFPTLGQKMGATGDLAGKMANISEQALQSFPGLGMMVNSARQGVRDVGQVGAFNRALGELKPFNNLPTSLPKDVGPGMQAHSITSGAFDKAYDAARSGMRMVPDPQFETEQAAFNSALGNSGLLSDAQAGQVNKVINDAVHSRLNMSGGELGGDAYKAASSQLDRTIRSWGSDPAKSDMASALSDFTTIFDNAARRASHPSAVSLLDAADRGYAQLVRIQRASELGGAAKDAGTFTPTNYAGAVKQMGGGVRSNAYSRGTALGQDYANALLPLRDTLPNSGTSERLLTSQALAGLGGGEIGAGGFLMAHPGSLAPFAAYLPGVRNVVNRAIAPNAQRLALLPPDVAAVLDRVGNKVNDIAPLIGKAAMPGSLAYYGVGQ